jgi:hypothetical protein
MWGIETFSLAENMTANCYEDYFPIDFVRNDVVAEGFLNRDNFYIEAENINSNTYKNLECRIF